MSLTMTVPATGASVAALERDVRCGYVTREAAEACYGAVFQDDTLTIEAAATI